MSARTKSCWPKRRRCHDKNFQTSGQTLGGLPCYYCPAVGAGIRRFDPAGLHQQNCGYRHPTVRHCGRCARSSAGFHPAGTGAADDGRGRRHGGSRLHPAGRHRQRTLLRYQLTEKARIPLYGPPAAGRCGPGYAGGGIFHPGYCALSGFRSGSRGGQRPGCRRAGYRYRPVCGHDPDARFQPGCRTGPAGRSHGSGRRK